ncbi:DUF1344 domain-containing protein [Thioclava sp. BHET1]|nr:DUF1344 domain-containing protein [Thioclava sp. BHET1]
MRNLTLSAFATVIAVTAGAIAADANENIYPSSGVVKTVDPAHHSFELTDGESYTVTPPSEIEKLQPGQKIQFKVHAGASGSLVNDIYIER